MEVRVITAAGAQVVPTADLQVALADPEATVWVDIPDCDEESLSVLRDVFGFHAVTIWECRQRQRMAKFHPYPDHVFVVLHSPELGDHGHVHYVELDHSCTSISDSESRAEVASSKIMIGGFFRSALAMEMRCLCPPESFVPRSPIIVSYP